MEHRIFISWSGDLSKEVAQLIHEWLPGVFEEVKPWMSDNDIAAGDNWKEELESVLEEAEFCIVCVTQLSHNSPWLNYEIGRLKDKAICPLFIDLSPNEIDGPLKGMQGTTFDQTGMLKLVRTLNKLGDTACYPDQVLENLFLGAWPKLEEKYKSLSDAELNTSSHLVSVCSESMRNVHGEQKKILSASETEPNVFPIRGTTYRNKNQSTDVLIVVDIQNDFFPGGALVVKNVDSLIDPLNKAINQAERMGMEIIFVQDWHSPDHSSFELNGGEWPLHCIENTAGASLHRDLYQPQDSHIIRFGQRPTSLGYSPFENEELDDLINRAYVKTIYVVGIALEYCVLATCIDAKKRQKRVIALEPLIRPAEPEQAENLWRVLEKEQIIRALDFNPDRMKSPGQSTSGGFPKPHINS